MFSSSNNGISLPQLSTSFNNPTNFFLGLCDDEKLLHRQHDLLSRCLTVAPVIETAKEIMLSTKSSTSTNPEIYRPKGDHGRPLNAHSKNKTLRKDRHSKNFTAQGPRNRRVRLSIDIARKFFDLQDMLGFDKASKTIDWLLTKSKTSIKEPIHMKHTDDASAKTLCSSSELYEFAVGSNHKDAEKGDSKRASKRKRIQGTIKFKAAKVPTVAKFDKLAKESRSKARERARERTKQKICLMKKLNDTKKSPDLHPLIPNQSRSWSHIESCMTSDSSSRNVISSLDINTGMDKFFCFRPGSGEVDTEKRFQESVMITREIKPSIFGFQQNLVISKEASTNFCHWPPITTQNWDIGCKITSSSLCAMTNMSSSKVLQRCGKPLDMEDNDNNQD